MFGPLPIWNPAHGGSVAKKKGVPVGTRGNNRWSEPPISPEDRGARSRENGVKCEVQVQGFSAIPNAGADTPAACHQRSAPASAIHVQRAIRVAASVTSTAPPTAASVK